MVDHLAEVATYATGACGGLESDELWLDIGSNDGCLLRQALMVAGGVPRLCGIDPLANRMAGSYPNTAFKIPHFFSAAAVRRHFGNGVKCKIITSIACFYDVTSPLIFARDVSILLDDDCGSGVWVLEQSYLPAMLERTAYDTICHEHLEYYRLTDLCAIAKAVRLKVS
jgi:NDP-4-keto-2,6-dideoxyhexose 3-C-methyltransferase